MTFRIARRLATLVLAAGLLAAAAGCGPAGTTNVPASEPATPSGTGPAGAGEAVQSGTGEAAAPGGTRESASEAASETESETEPAPTAPDGDQAGAGEPGAATPPQSPATSEASPLTIADLFPTDGIYVASNGAREAWHVKNISDTKVDYWYDKLAVWHLQAADGCLVQKSYSEGDLTVPDGTILYCLPIKSFKDDVQTEDAEYVDNGTEEWTSDLGWGDVLHVHVMQTASGDPQGKFVLDRYYAPGVGLVAQTRRAAGAQNDAFRLARAKRGPLSQDDVDAIQHTIEQFAALTTAGKFDAIPALLTGNLTNAYDPKRQAAMGIKQMKLTSFIIDGAPSKTDATAYVTFTVTFAGENHSAWNTGDNPRWVRLKQIDGHWKIAELATGP